MRKTISLANQVNYSNSITQLTDKMKIEHRKFPVTVKLCVCIKHSTEPSKFGSFDC